MVDTKYIYRLPKKKKIGENNYGSKNNQETSEGITIDNCEVAQSLKNNLQACNVIAKR